MGDNTIHHVDCQPSPQGVALAMLDALPLHSLCIARLSVFRHDKNVRNEVQVDSFKGGLYTERPTVAVQWTQPEKSSILPQLYPPNMASAPPHRSDGNELNSSAQGPVSRLDNLMTGEKITLRVSGLATTMFLVDRASVQAGFVKIHSMGSRGSHHFSLTLLKGHTARRTVLFMIEMSELVNGIWWGINDQPEVVETKLEHSVEELESVLAKYYRFEIRV